MKSRRKLLASLAVAACASLGFTNASGQEEAFPVKPIHIIVPAGPGAIVDTIARDLGQQLSRRLAQSVIIENKPGVSTMLAAQYVARSAPDGYTLLMATSSTLSIGPYLYKNLGIDPLKDLIPVTLVGTAPVVLMVSGQMPVKSVSELVQKAKAAPETISFVSSGVGGLMHLNAVNFQKATGAKLIHVPYQNYPGQSVADLSSNRVQLVIDVYGTSAGSLSNGNFRPLAVLSKSRLPQLPDVPTATEAGYPSLTADLWFGFAVANKTPGDRVQKLSKEISQILAEPAFREKYAAFGVRTSGSTPAELGALINADGQRWAALIREENIKLD